VVAIIFSVFGKRGGESRSRADFGELEIGGYFDYPIGGILPAGRSPHLIAIPVGMVDDDYGNAGLAQHQ
jgi:hypothetical protein